jgi:predicted nuclease of predicted toxin-antitoxin system
VRFKVDENLPQDVAMLLRENGYDAVSVFDQSLSGETDIVIFEVCQNEERVLVTLDLDFSNIQSYPPASANGMIVLRLGRQDKASVLDVMERLIPVFKTQQLDHKLWIVEKDRIRIRV